MKRTASITFETEETIVIGHGSVLERGFCPHCDRMVDMITPYMIWPRPYRPEGNAKYSGWSRPG
ncbi:MAG: hypothetical protein ABI878_03855 [Acidobacteriota bacterium]